MKSYLSLIPISAKVHRRQNRMTLLCIVFAVFMVTAVFSMAEMGARMEYTRLLGKHGKLSMTDLLGSYMGQSLLLVACVLFLLILIAGVLMISSSMNSTVAQRIKFFGMMRCFGEEELDFDDRLFCTQHHYVFEFFHIRRFCGLSDAAVCCHIRY